MLACGGRTRILARQCRRELGEHLRESIVSLAGAVHGRECRAAERVVRIQICRALKGLLRHDEIASNQVDNAASALQRRCGASVVFGKRPQRVGLGEVCIAAAAQQPNDMIVFGAEALAERAGATPQLERTRRVTELLGQRRRPSQCEPASVLEARDGARRRRRELEQVEPPLRARVLCIRGDGMREIPERCR